MHSPLMTLDENEALQLVQRRAPEACDSDPNAAVTLVQPVGGLPLAIRQIGGYLAAADSRLLVHAALELDAFMPLEAFYRFLEGWSPEHGKRP